MDVQEMINAREAVELLHPREFPFRYYFGKRCFDIVASIIGLIVLSPLFLITAIAILAEDGAPVFYCQDRTGMHGKVFRIYKFRSMCRDAEKMHRQLLAKNELNGPAFKIKEDPRITKVGKFIRRTSIDELPQLVNIIKGDMSIVGPRPLPTYEAAQCTYYQNQRLQIRPGLTCYWQCSGRSDIPFDEWMEMDLQYIKDAGYLVDFKIIFRTVIKVLKGEGAY